MRTALLISLVLLATAMPASALARSPVCPPSAEGVAAAAGAGETVIACVGSRALTEATFEHWREVAAASASSERHAPSARALLVQVMDFLLSTAWVQGEAKALGVHVSPAAVRREFERLRHAQFPRRRDFRRFLRKSKQTVADLLMRVELDMLTTRIQRRIAAGHRDAKAQQEALRRFILHFRDKWTGRTYCAPHYAVRDCGHVQSSL